MKKVIQLVVTTLLLTACQSPGVSATESVTKRGLQNHHFDLISVNNEDISNKNDSKLSISFDGRMNISGTMCNNFMGIGKLKNNILTVKNLTGSEMYCVNERLNQWDHVLNDVLTKGAKISLKGKQLTLVNGKNTLVYILRDLSQ
ncbi:META domain-containing protein [Xenorhabdus sp. Sc-CR9]|uniref:META domain-containing protein n=1 Tax=Xenorhabdus sp. Sc-CR9 TaxID=2584468 RepID=UPI001F41CFE9|nr:META domain-containing protein [Xenorhabdus sp. Sc-CR9]